NSKRRFDSPHQVQSPRFSSPFLLPPGLGPLVIDFLLVGRVGGPALEEGLGSGCNGFALLEALLRPPPVLAGVRVRHPAAPAPRPSPGPPCRSGRSGGTPGWPCGRSRSSTTGRRHPGWGIRSGR